MDRRGFLAAASVPLTLSIPSAAQSPAPTRDLERLRLCADFVNGQFRSPIFRRGLLVAPDWVWEAHAKRDIKGQQTTMGFTRDRIDA
jgi:hypothetical protein